MVPQSVGYDLQVFANGSWRTIGGFQDPRDAITKAQAIETGPAREAVRVVHEVYDPDQGRFRQETIFRRSILNQDRIETAQSEMAVARLLRERQRPRPARPVGKPAREGDWPLFSQLGIRVLILLAAGALAMIAIERIVVS